MPTTAPTLPRRDRVRPRRLGTAAGALLLALLATLSGATPAQGLADGAGGTGVSDGGLVVVINGDLRLPSIDGPEIRRLFLGESRRLPNGARAALASYAPARSFFNERALGLSDARVATIWSRLQFAGRLPPPKVFDTAAEVVAFVASTPNAIAYLPADAPRDGVRVIYTMPR